MLACGALAREVLAVCRQAGLEHVELHCLPAILHNHPERIAPAVDERLAELKAAGADEILVAYGDCGTGGALARVVERHGARMLPGAHCYSFFEGVERFEARGDEIDRFYLTDFLARHFETFVVRPLRLREHPELRDMMFAHYRGVVHLEQAADEETRRAAATAAAFLGLPLERRSTGYGDLGRALRGEPVPPPLATPEPVAEGATAR